MSRYYQIALALTCFGLGAAGNAWAQFVPIPLPNAVYTSETHLPALTGPDYVNLASLSDGTLTVGFSDSVGVRTVPTGWQTWGSPPYTESSAPRILRQSGNSLTLTFSSPLDIFGLEAEPADFGLSTITAQFFDGAINVGTISQQVDGHAGARLFAASDITTPFTSVLLSTNDARFALAQLRYSLTLPSSKGNPASLTPEPSGLVFGIGAGLFVTGLLRSRRLCRRRLRT